jgi:hypothetical protein
MEDVLAVDTRVYAPRFPQVCLDETRRQVLGDVREPLAAAPRRPQREDYEDVRHGVCNLFLVCEPLRGWRHVAVTARRTLQDWAHLVRDVVAVRYPDAERLVLVLDKRNLHAPTALYATFPPAEARRRVEKLEIHYTPKHGSWLNMAAIELSALSGQCLARRFPDRDTLAREVAPWEATRNGEQTTVDWRFTTADARIKLSHLYPSLPL